MIFVYEIMFMYTVQYLALLMSFLLSINLNTFHLQANICSREAKRKANFRNVIG
jgi:hypothetical protein